MTPKVNAYNDTLKEVQDEERSQGITLDWGGLTVEQRHLIYGGGKDGEYDSTSHSFQYEVFSKFGLHAEAAQHRDPTAADFANIKSQLLATAGMATMLVTMLVTPLVLIFLGSLRGAARTTVASSNELMTNLPQDLRIFRLPAMAYAILIETGRIIDLKIWSETNVKITSSGGGGYISGTAHNIWGHISAPQIQSKTTITRNDQVWVRTLDGKELEWTFRNGVFPVRVGQVVSVVSQHTGKDYYRAVLGFNHTTGKFIEVNPPDHALRGFLLWLATAAAGCASLWIGASLIKKASIDYSLWYFFIGIAVVALIYIGILKLIYRVLRDWRFGTYRKKLQRYLNEATPDIVRDYNAADGVVSSSDPTGGFISEG